MLSKEQRRRAAEDVANAFIVTPSCVQAKAAFDTLMRVGRVAGALCLLLCGESGVGKSTLVKWLTRKMAVERTAEGVRRPALYLEIPTAPTAISVFESMLSALGDPKPEHGTRNAKFLRLVKLLSDQQVRVMVIDEMQHMYDRHSQRILFDASEAIKQLLSACPISVICVGLPDSHKVVDSNEQLSRRHMATVSIERFDWNKPRSRADFVATLAAFRKAMGCYDMPDIADQSVAIRFYLATGGIMDFVRKLFLFAADMADNRALNVVGLDVFDESWSMAFLHGSGTAGPFRRTFKSEIEMTALAADAMRINAAPPSASLRKGGAAERLRAVGL